MGKKQENKKEKKETQQKEQTEHKTAEKQTKSSEDKKILEFTESYKHLEKQINTLIEVIDKKNTIEFLSIGIEYYNTYKKELEKLEEEITKYSEVRNLNKSEEDEFCEKHTELEGKLTQITGIFDGILEKTRELYVPEETLPEPKKEIQIKEEIEEKKEEIIKEEIKEVKEEIKEKKEEIKEEKTHQVFIEMKYGVDNFASRFKDRKMTFFKDIKEYYTKNKITIKTDKGDKEIGLVTIIDTLTESTKIPWYSGVLFENKNYKMKKEALELARSNFAELLDYAFREFKNSGEPVPDNYRYAIMLLHGYVRWRGEDKESLWKSIFTSKYKYNKDKYKELDEFYENCIIGSKSPSSIFGEKSDDTATKPA